jgi:hypothetical protein
MFIFSPGRNQMFSIRSWFISFSRLSQSDPNNFVAQKKNITKTKHIPHTVCFSVSASASSRVDLGLPAEWSRIHMWLSAIPA